MRNEAGKGEVDGMVDREEEDIGEVQATIRKFDWPRSNVQGRALVKVKRNPREHTKMVLGTREDN
jgi:hypothetical protein